MRRPQSNNKQVCHSLTRGWFQAITCKEEKKKGNQRWNKAEMKIQSVWKLRLLGLETISCKITSSFHDVTVYYIFFFFCLWCAIKCLQLFCFYEKLNKNGTQWEPSVFMPMMTPTSRYSAVLWCVCKHPRWHRNLPESLCCFKLVFFQVLREVIMSFSCRGCLQWSVKLTNYEPKNSSPPSGGFPFGAGPKNVEPLENVAWHFPKDTGVRKGTGNKYRQKKKKKFKSRRFILCDGWNRISLVILPVTFTARPKAQNKTKKQEEKPTARINTSQPVNRMSEASALRMLWVGLLFHHRALP